MTNRSFLHFTCPLSKTHPPSSTPLVHPSSASSGLPSLSGAGHFSRAAPGTVEQGEGWRRARLSCRVEAGEQRDGSWLNTRLSALHTGGSSLLPGLAALHGLRAEPARVLAQGWGREATVGSHTTCPPAAVSAISAISAGGRPEGTSCCTFTHLPAGSSGCPGCCVTLGSSR